MENKEKQKQDTTWLYRFMEDHAPWFWCVFSVCMVLVFYKAFSLAFLKKTPYLWDDVFQHTALSLLCILMMRETYQGKFRMGFVRAGFWHGVWLCWPVFLIVVFNLCLNVRIGQINPENLVMHIFDNASVGLFEEVVARAILVGHMMHHWREDPRRVFKSVLWSSVIFGVLHIGNMFTNPFQTILQIGYATGVGIVFAAAYIRTRNLWSCILVHGLVDFAGSISDIYVPLQADMAAYQASLQALPGLMDGVSDYWFELVSLSLILLMLVLGIIAGIAGVYMLRPAKRKQIDRIWKE